MFRFWWLTHYDALITLITNKLWIASAEPWMRHLFILFYFISPHFLHAFPSIYTFVWSSTLYPLVFWRRIVLSPLCLCPISHADPCHVKHPGWYDWKVWIVQWLSAVRQNRTRATLNGIACLSWSKSFIASFACGPCVSANSSYTLVPFSSVLIS